MAPFGLELFASRATARANSPFNLTELSSLGTQTQFTALAYDSAQDLLAFGAKDGRVLIIGHEWETYLIGSCSPVTTLAFKVGDKFLVAGNDRGELLVWNLQKRHLQFAPVALKAAITSLEAPFGTSVVYVGLANGSVVFVDSGNGQLSEYNLPYPDGAAEGDRSVVSLHTSPTDENLLLIGYSSGVMLVWDLAERLVRRQAAASEHLRSACWDRTGQRFAGATSSAILIWEFKDGWLDSLKKSSLMKVTRTVGHSWGDCTTLRCVQRQSAEGTLETCLLLGGRDGVGICPIDSKGKAPPSWTPVYSTSIGPFTVIDNKYLIAVTSEGCVKSVNLWSPASCLRISSSLELGSGAAITAMAVAGASEYLGYDMKNMSLHGDAAAELPLSGGTVINKNGKSTWDVLATVHEDDFVAFWQLSVPPRFLCRMPLFEKPVEGAAKISMDLEHRSLLVTVGTATRNYRWHSASEAKAYKEKWDADHDVDGLMAKMDAAVDEVLRQAKTTKTMRRAEDKDGVDENCTDDILPPPLPPRDASAEAVGESLAKEANCLRSQESASNPSPPLPPREEGSELTQRPETFASTPLATPSSAGAATAPTLEEIEQVDPAPNSPTGSETPPQLPQRPSARRRDQGYVDSDFEPEASDAGGWQPVLQVTHGDPIDLVCCAPWLDLLVTVTGGHRLNIVHDGSIHRSDAFGGERDETISLIHVVDTYFNKGPAARSCILVGTSSGEINACALDGNPATGETTVLRTVLYTPTNPQKPLFIAVTDDAGRIVQQAVRQKAGTPPSDHYILIVLENSVCVVVLEAGKNPEILANWSSPDRLVAAGLCWIAGEAVMVVITHIGTIKAIKLPSLEPLWRETLPLGQPERLYAQGLGSTFIAKDGRMVLWTGEKEFRVFSIAKDTTSLPDVEFRMYELTKAMEWARINNARLPSTAHRTERDKLCRCCRCLRYANVA
ncbi:WD40-repeat-containing domain protein [Geranomyces variabilis]|nr:WD40-repeat-containing domain protein [Geranomyces variabilis]